jgi:tRNA threonylcarbamoyladenosine biosynthesis protein TsaE
VSESASQRPQREPIALSDDAGGASGGRHRYLLETRRATIRLAQRLSGALRLGDLLVLTGNLGVGKTFFVRAMCRAFGVPSDVRVTSPSFSLVNELSARLPILHIDLYRIGDRSEVEMLGLRERRDSAVMLVEWGASYTDELGGEALHLELAIDEPSDRRIATLWEQGAPDTLVRAVQATAARS